MAVWPRDPRSPLRSSHEKQSVLLLLRSALSGEACSCIGAYSFSTPHGREYPWSYWARSSFFFFVLHT
jgi:hypothetical protein